MMEKDKDGVLGGMFAFKKLPHGAFDKTKIMCTISKAEFKYLRMFSF